ncbi:MAG: ImmA/IrrE family metallo-endopeptidase [Bacteroidota bacterium]
MTENQYFPQSRPHPGVTLSEKLEEMAMGPKEFALRTGKPEKTITALLKGESSITPDMAVQFESVTKIPVHFWMNHQRSYDEYISRKKYEAVIKAAMQWAKAFPLNEMMKKEWLQPARTDYEKTVALLSFFGFANHFAWEDYYLNQQLKIAFRISLADIPEPYAISAWLRQGELQAASLKAREYSEKDFKASLPAIKSLMKIQSKDIFDKLQDLCLQSGVKLVVTSSLSKAPISGSTHWINDTPLIQLNGRDPECETFWFTFFHETGHILLHGKKDIFLERIEYACKDETKEAQADTFALKWIGADSAHSSLVQ